MFDTLQEIFGILRRNKMRTIATGFAVVSGLFLLIVLQGAGNGVIHSFEYNMGDFAFDAIHIYGGRTTKPFEGIREGRTIQLDDRDWEMAEKHFPNHIDTAIPTIEKSSLTANYGQNHISASLSGVYPQYAASMAIKILRGRFINEIDLGQTRKVVVIGDKAVEQLFPKNTDALGRIVCVNGIAYKVVGIYKTNEMQDASWFYSPYTTVSTIYNKGRFIDELTMNIRNIPTEEAMDTFMNEYTRATSRIHTFHPDDKQALWIWNQAGDNIQMHKAGNILHTAFWILGLLTLLSGVVSVSNIMLISVGERTREFGIRRAIGAHPSAIIRMVMLESVLITGVFGYIGMFLGVLFCEYMNATVGNQVADLGVMQAKYFVDPTVGLSTCLQATLVIVVAGALAGFFPAWKAMKVKPIEALKA